MKIKITLETGDVCETSTQELNTLGDEWREMSIKGDCIQLWDYLEDRNEWLEASSILVLKRGRS